MNLTLLFGQRNIEMSFLPLLKFYTNSLLGSGCFKMRRSVFHGSDIVLGTTRYYLPLKCAFPGDWQRDSLRPLDVSIGGVFESRGADDRESDVPRAADRSLETRRQVGRGGRPVVANGDRQRKGAQRTRERRHRSHESSQRPAAAY